MRPSEALMIYSVNHLRLSEVLNRQSEEQLLYSEDS